MNSTEQTVMPAIITPFMEKISFKPVSGREYPAVWVAKLAVFSDWPPSKDTLLRLVELRRGLNILWAKPTGATNEISRMAGHGAGKTTFCRLVRYILDDPVSGSTEFRESFKKNFRVGWVIAEVYIGGTRWLVGRPIIGGIGYHSFAKQGGTLDDEFADHPSRTGYADYVAAMDASVFGKMELRTLSDSRDTLDWPRLLPWLSRDQESHFSGLLEWRHQDSDSKSPDLSHEDKANLIRLMLGLVDAEEQDLLAEFSAKSQTHEQKLRDRPKMEFAVSRERKALENAIHMAVESPDAPLLQNEVSKRAAELRAQSSAAIANAKHNLELDLLMAEVSRRQADYGFMNAMAEELEDTVESLESRVSGSTPPQPKPRVLDPYREAMKGLGPFPGYCSHEMDKAWKAGCPIARERPKDDEITNTTKQIAAETKPEFARLAGLKAELARRRQVAATKRTALLIAEKALRDARNRHQDEMEKLQESAQEAARITSLLTSYRQACTDLLTLDEDLVTLKRNKEDLDKQLIDLTKRHMNLVEKFGQLFNHIARHMLGEAVTGRVRFSGKSIVPEIDYHGPRDSAALKVTKWLAFDLSALALGMTSSAAYHPRFLLHDSPREADLAAGIYGALFTAARELEKESHGEPAFQYIITTTEPPPDDLKMSPWLIFPILDATKSDGRFLGVDL